MQTNPLLFAMVFHVLWVAMLYVLLTILRAPSIWGVDTKTGLVRQWAKLEPRVSANLSNQFEWPLLFYAACLLVTVQSSTTEIAGIQILLASLFIVGRIAHSFVQIFTTNIRLRGAVFTVNFLAVLGMWIKIAMDSI